MKYKSTRSDNDNDAIVSFETALCNGYSPIDGGLYVPIHLNNNNDDNKFITIENLLLWKLYPYSQLMYTILRYFIDMNEISNDDLQAICNNAFISFANPNSPIPVVPIQIMSNNDDTTTTTNNNDNDHQGKKYPSVSIAELFHGPTFCFKDYGMRIVIYLLSYFATKRQNKILLLVSTTGDTGPAAIQAVSDCHNPLLQIIIHYPYQQISNIQRKQLTTASSSYSHVVAFEGGGDDMDIPLKKLLYKQQNKQNKQKQHEEGNENDNTTSKNNDTWTGVNSYNIGRPLAQMVHYIWSYLRFIEQQEHDEVDSNKIVIGDIIDVIVPTGAMGNVVAGYMCQLCGLPIRKFVLAVNTNDITYRFIQTGLFKSSTSMIKTLSDAINIQVPYNMERLLYYVCNENSIMINDYMKQFDVCNQYQVSSEILHKIQQNFISCSITDDTMCSTIRYIQQNTSNQYLIDPHTAIAVSAAIQLGYIPSSSSIQHQSNNKERLPPTVIIATASPCKFEESMTIAIGKEKWNEYYNSISYPISAKELYNKIETPPTFYPKVGTSLEESQMIWEQYTYHIITNDMKNISLPITTIKE